MNRRTPAGKPLLTSLTSRSVMDSKRWVWLIVNTISGTRTATKDFYIPEKIIDHIPSYKTKLQDRLAAIEGDGEPTIRDLVRRDLEPFTKAIRFLASGHLAPLDTSAPTCSQTLDGHVELFKLSRKLSIKCLEDAVLDQIDNLQFRALPHVVFLGFARSYYIGGADTQHTSLGELIKKKLFSLLPYLQQSMSVGELSSEDGILGKQLMTVLLEDRAKPHVAPGFGAMRVKVESEVEDD